MSGKRETYTHRPMTVSDSQMASNWTEVDWNARERDVPPIKPVGAPLQQQAVAEGQGGATRQ